VSPEAAETGTRSGLDTAERIVVKIGSALLVDEKGGEIRRDWLNALADDIAGLGHRFLGPVERCAVLLHLIDAGQVDPAEA
jgi:hypothetical protein